MNESPLARLRQRTRDDVAYMLPMIAFLLLLWCGGNWKQFYPHFYVARAAAAAVLLVIYWPRYTKITWSFWWLGALLGVIGIILWIAIQIALQPVGFHDIYPFKPSPDAFDPTMSFASATTMWTWIVIRTLSASIVVPLMEERFWRDFLWRSIIAPNDFKLARIGEWDAAAFFIVCGAFAAVHGNWWPTAIIWGAMVGALLVYTKSLGACITMHAVSNALLAAYVLHYKAWWLW